MPTLLKSWQLVYPSLATSLATWCGPCKKIAPIIEELAGEYEGRVVIGKCDVDENDELTAKYGIRNVPTVLFIKGGEVVDKHVGAAAKSDFVQKVEALPLIFLLTRWQQCPHTTFRL